MMYAILQEGGQKRNMGKRTATEMQRFASQNAAKPTEAEEHCLILLYQIRKYLKFKNIDIGPIDKQFVWQSRSHKSNYITDFYIERLKLAIEVDGGYHDNRKEYDERRDQLISQPRKYDPGRKVIRYKNDEIMAENARERLREEIMERIKEKGIQSRLFVTPWKK